MGRSARLHNHRGQARHLGASATVRDVLAVVGQPLLSTTGQILLTANSGGGSWRHPDGTTTADDPTAGGDPAAGLRYSWRAASTGRGRSSSRLARRGLGGVHLDRLVGRPRAGGGPTGAIESYLASPVSGCHLGRTGGSRCRRACGLRNPAPIRADGWPSDRVEPATSRSARTICR